MRKVLPALLCALLLGSAFHQGAGQQKNLRLLIIGAHPDDADNCGGLAARYVAMGHKARLVSVTNGCAGHQSTGGGALAKRRAEEARRAGQTIGAEYIVLDNPDGEITPSLDVRRQIIRTIREFKPDLIVSPRPNDYHPDHRYTAILIQDAAYMVTVPNIVSSVPHLEKNPVIVYTHDDFQKPVPFKPDVVVDVTEFIEKKIDMLDCHESQMYEWLPYNRGILNLVPAGKAERRKWLGETWKPLWSGIADKYRDKLIELYGRERAANVRYAEAFEGCEYGSRLTPENVKVLFPFF
jgi:LmbE family N-acetylglucosaminyl deacetylase